jgi:hypothetical protein
MPGPLFRDDFVGQENGFVPRRGARPAHGFASLSLHDDSALERAHLQGRLWRSLAPSPAPEPFLRPPVFGVWPDIGTPVCWRCIAPILPRIGRSLTTVTALQPWLLVQRGRVTRRKFAGPRGRFGNLGLRHADFLPEAVHLRGKLGQALHSPERLRLPFRIENLLCHWLSLPSCRNDTPPGSKYALPAALVSKLGSEIPVNGSLQ